MARRRLYRPGSRAGTPGRGDARRSRWAWLLHGRKERIDDFRPRACEIELPGPGGDRFDYFIASHANRIAIAQYASDAIIEHGINDLTAGRALVSILADQQTLRGYLPASMKVSCVTVEPVSTSSDTWAKTANQTTNANKATRVLFNAAQRAIPAGLATCLDIADAVESGRDSGKWTSQYGTLPTYGTHGSGRGFTVCL